jgi:tripartite-type tricarboxylate transporter receptor subunit TctC
LVAWVLVAAAISVVPSGGSLVVDRNVVPVNSVMELVDYAKKNPGKLSFGSSGAARSSISPANCSTWSPA